MPQDSTRAALRGWIVASLVYLLAVLHRTSLGVAGLIAEHRFAVTPGQLSVFVLMQLGVYAAMQVPTGVLVDRYGPRRLLLVASLVMGTAQLLFATVDSYPAALAARALLGCGDALTFVSVIRFAGTHFSARRYPLFVALTATIGTVGNIVATLPLSLLLRHYGWTVTFGIAGALSLAAGAAVYAFVPDHSQPPTPIHGVADVAAGLRSVHRRIRRAWSLPGTRLGFWVHAASMSTPTAFGVLWAGAYLTTAAHLSASAAGAVLMAGVILAAIASPIFGAMIGHYPAIRVPIGMYLSVATVLSWTLLVLLGGDAPPKAVVATLFIVMTLGGPASMSAFAVARDYNGPDTLGTASGLVNVGGFATTIVIAVGMGWVIDLLGGTTPHALRWAALVAVVVQLLAASRVFVWYRRVRARALVLQARGELVPVSVSRRRWFDLVA
jgi:MFS family permease